MVLSENNYRTVVEAEVYDLLIESFGKDFVMSKKSKESSFYNLIDVKDSLEFLEVQFGLESYFDIDIPTKDLEVLFPEEYSRIDQINVRNVVDYISNRGQ